MVAAVAIWSVASASHSLMTGFWGFAFARGLLGLGEGATFPGGLRTAVESLPSNRRARGIATSFSGGTIGAIVTPLIVIPIALAVRMAQRISTQRSARNRLDLFVACSRPASISAENRPQTQDNFVAQPIAAPLLGARLQLRATCNCTRTDIDDYSALPQPRHARYTVRIERYSVAAARCLGRWIFPLGLDRGPVCGGQSPADWLVRSTDRSLSGVRVHHMDKFRL